MSRSRPLPPAPDHQRHDALLIAQFAAGDMLDGPQQAEAQRLVSTCGACGALVADLRAVSSAVAHEPVPRRRRDFRLTPEQAQDLSGNALSRFLRGLSLPRARVFQPVAAGVLSIGLAFVVVGYAWPDGGAIVVTAEPNVGLQQQVVAASPLAEPLAASSLAPTPTAAEPLAPAPTTADPGDDVVALRAEQEAAADALKASSGTAEFFEELPEHQAGGSASAIEESTEADDLAPLERAKSLGESDGLEASEHETAELGAATAASNAGFADALDSDVADNVDVADVADNADNAADVPRANVAEAMESRSVDLPAVDGEASDLVMADEAAPVAPAEGELTADDDDLASTLIFVGLLLALGGGGLLLLGWLARRTRDPLLR